MAGVAAVEDVFENLELAGVGVLRFVDEADLVACAQAVGEQLRAGGGVAQRGAQARIRPS